MTNKDLHIILTQEMDSNRFVTNSLMNKIAFEHRDIKDNLYELMSQGKVVKTSTGYIIKK